MGVAGAVALNVGIAAVQVLAFRPFLTSDESPHVNYALRLTHGEIPQLGTRFAPSLPLQGSGTQYVSNHPPLFHIMAGWLIRLGQHFDHSLVGFYLARGLSAAFGAATVLAVAALTLSLGGRRARERAVTAAAISGVFSPLAISAVTVQNDSLLALCATTALLATMRILRFGGTVQRWILLAVACTAGMLTKSSMIVVFGAAVATLAVEPLLRLTRAAWRARILPLAAVIACVIAGSGWFYVLNHRRYGDLLGGSEIYENVSSRPLEPSASSPLRFVLDPRSWRNLFEQAFAGRTSVRLPDPSETSWMSELAAALVVLGAGWAAARALLATITARRRRPDPNPGPGNAEGGHPLGPGDLLPALLLALALLGAVAEIASHVSHRGSANARYLAPAIAAYSIGVATVLIALPAIARTLAAVLVVALHAVGTVGEGVILIHRLPSTLGRSWLGTYERGLIINGRPGVLAPLLLSVAGASLVALTVALMALGDGPWAARRRQPIDTEADTSAPQESQHRLEPA
ncbi:MAG: glycosyltransferase family 39 protein [bacterium]